MRLTELPGWYPRSFDNAPIYRAAMEEWMKTPDFEEQEPEVEKAALLVYAGIKDLETKEAARKAALQSEVAESMGAENAAKPARTKPLPSQPSEQTLEEPRE